MHALPAALQASAKGYSLTAITYVWQYETPKESEKWSLVLLKKKTKTKEQPTPSRSHFKLTLVKHRNICLNTTDSREICHIQQALFSFA